MKPASPVTVDLYRLAYNAGRAVTFDELVDGMPSAYQNDANRWWVEKEQAAGRDIPAEPWSPSMLRSVKAEWVSLRLAGAIRDKRFSANRADGNPGPTAGRPRDQLVYSVVKEPDRAGHGGPPMVLEEVLTKRMVRWTPEIGATGRRHVAGIKFRDEVARIRALGARASKHDLEEALQLAVEALQVGSERP